MFVFQFNLVFLLQVLHVLGSPIPDTSVWSVPLPLLVTLARNIVVANAAGMVVLLCVFLVNGFIIQHTYLHPWVLWLVGSCLGVLQYHQKKGLANI